MTSELSDIELADQVRNGNVQAYAALVTRYQDKVYNLAYRMTGSHADAAEMAQDAFVKAYEKIHLYNARYAFGNWVMGICANQSKNLFRSRTRRRNAEQQHVELRILDETSSSPDAREAELSEALMKLPEPSRIAVTLKHMEGCSYEEMADLLRIGTSAAKMRVKRGIEQLAEMISANRTEGVAT